MNIKSCLPVRPSVCEGLTSSSSILTYQPVSGVCRWCAVSVGREHRTTEHVTDIVVVVVVGELSKAENDEAGGRTIRFVPLARWRQNYLTHWGL